jgi:hypothetical protein
MGATSQLASAPLREGTRERVRIGIFPPAARATRPRLFAALEAAYPVSFEGREDGDWGGFDAVIAFGKHRPVSALRAGAPFLWAIGKESTIDGETASFELVDTPLLARALRGAHLSEGFSSPLSPAVLTAAPRVLATLDGAPAWVSLDGAEEGEGFAGEVVAVAPAELDAEESLRERLAPGRCLALLALVNFIQRVAGDGHAQKPVLGAAFILDDPNLHWPTYGHLHYEKLAFHAREHGYHMAIAMAPLDGKLAHPKAVRIFKENSGQLSLCVHGNNHLGPELGRIATDRDGLVLARQALARAVAFQRRTGIPFERVMVPPHEQLSESAARGLLAGGFDAVCVSLPYPWIAPSRPGPAAALGTGPPERGALAGWPSREIVVDGLPLILRTGFNAPREDLVLRAFLGQPLIVYGHHDVLEHGLDVLAETAAAIGKLGDVRWSSLSGIAHAGVTPAHVGLPEPYGEPRVRIRPLLRRLASEARDRARIS